MKTILEVLNLSTEYLQNRGIDQPRHQAQELMSDALGIPKMQLYIEFDRPLSEEELGELRGRLARRAKGEPLQYIHGKVEFFDCLLTVTPHVLIPRQETGILVDKIMNELKQLDLQEKTFLDLCCGSGCIGIAIKKRFPQMHVILSDICPQALAVARQNAFENGVDVEFLTGDLLHPFQGRKTHFLVCNPPYISEDAYPQLEREVRCYEPKIALVGGKIGIEFYKRLESAMPAMLHTSAKIWLEIGFDQGERLRALFQNSPWKNCRLERDWSGNDRFFFLEIE